MAFDPPHHTTSEHSNANHPIVRKINDRIYDILLTSFSDFLLVDFILVSKGVCVFLCLIVCLTVCGGPASLTSRMVTLTVVCVRYLCLANFVDTPQCFFAFIAFGQYPRACLRKFCLVWIPISTVFGLS